MSAKKDSAKRLRAEEMLADECADGLHEAQRQARLAILDRVI
jgi:hypothetical protein